MRDNFILNQTAGRPRRGKRRQAIATIKVRWGKLRAGAGRSDGSFRAVAPERLPAKWFHRFGKRTSGMYLTYGTHTTRVAKALASFLPWKNCGVT